MLFEIIPGIHACMNNTVLALSSTLLSAMTFRKRSGLSKTGIRTHLSRRHDVRGEHRVPLLGQLDLDLSSKMEPKARAAGLGTHFPPHLRLGSSHGLVLIRGGQCWADGDGRAPQSHSFGAVNHEAATSNAVGSLQWEVGHLNKKVSANAQEEAGGDFMPCFRLIVHESHMSCTQ